MSLFLFNIHSKVALASQKGCLMMFKPNVKYSQAAIIKQSQALLAGDG